MIFKRNGYRVIEKYFSKSDLHDIRENWQEELKNFSSYPANFEGRGIVFTAGGVRYVTCLWVSIHMLREKGCNLPIEVWYLGNEFSEDVIRTFEGLGVKCCNFYDYGPVSHQGYILKPLAIFNSSFKEVLFMDADNIAIRNPEYLFDTLEFREDGAIFWPDYWKTARSNPIWKITGSRKYDEPEQESGQILIDKERCWTALQLCIHFNKLGVYYYKLLLGDKDTFKFAWAAVNTKYHMISTAVGSCGYTDKNLFHGITMVQHDTFGRPIFLHRNFLKWDVTLDNERVWKMLKTYAGLVKRKHIIFNRLHKGHQSIDIQGDVTAKDCEELFGELELQCLSHLRIWRSSETYKNFMHFAHFTKYRFAPAEEFTLP